MNQAEGLLHLLKAEPTLLDEAPRGMGASLIERRRVDEIHSCLRCGQRAKAALIAETELGPRWLDLCWECYHWLRAGAYDPR